MASVWWELKIPYIEFNFLSANFPEWSVLSFSRNLPDLEIHDPKFSKQSKNSHEWDLIHTKFMGVHERLDVGNRSDVCL